MKPRKPAKPSPRRVRLPKSHEATQAEALAILAAEPGISGAKLGPLVGMSARWGQLFLKGLTTASAPKGPDAEETS